MARIPKKSGAKPKHSKTVKEKKAEPDDTDDVLKKTQGAYQHMMHRKLLPDYRLTEDEKNSYEEKIKRF